MPTSTITAKGQTTLPKSVRDYLGLRSHDKLLYTPSHGMVILRPLKGSIRDLKGVFKRRSRTQGPLDFKELRRAFELAMAENTFKEMR